MSNEYGVLPLFQVYRSFVVYNRFGYPVTTITGLKILVLKQIISAISLARLGNLDNPLVMAQVVVMHELAKKLTCSPVKTLLLILVYYALSVGLIFYQHRLLQVGIFGS